MLLLVVEAGQGNNKVHKLLQLRTGDGHQGGLQEVEVVTSCGGALTCQETHKLVNQIPLAHCGVIQGVVGTQRPDRVWSGRKQKRLDEILRDFTRHSNTAHEIDHVQAMDQHY